MGGKRKKLPSKGNVEEQVEEKEKGSSPISADDVDLPAALTPVIKKACEFKQGDLVFAKFKNYPFWPAVFYKYANKRNKKKQIAWVHFFEKETEPNKKIVLKVSLKNIRMFTCEERESFIKIGNTSVNYDSGMERANEYMRKRALGKILDFFLSVEEEYQSEDDVEAEETHQDVVSEASTPKKSKKKPSKLQLTSRKSQRQANYNHKELVSWITTFGKSLLLDISNEEVKSERHQTFMKGTQKEKGSLKWMSGFGPLGDVESENLFSLLMSWYKENFAHWTVNPITYVSDVWLPEAIIHSLANTRKVSKECAEKEFLN